MGRRVRTIPREHSCGRRVQWTSGSPEILRAVFREVTNAVAFPGWTSPHPRHVGVVDPADGRVGSVAYSLRRGIPAPEGSRTGEGRAGPLDDVARRRFARSAA